MMLSQITPSIAADQWPAHFLIEWIIGSALYRLDLNFHSRVNWSTFTAPERLVFNSRDDDVCFCEWTFFLCITFDYKSIYILKKLCNKNMYNDIINFDVTYIFLSSLHLFFFKIHHSSFWTLLNQDHINATRQSRD